MVKEHFGSGEKIISFIIFLFVLPILISGNLYQDDILRSANGEAYWGVLGRPLSDLVVMSIGFGRGFVINTFPLSLIIATIFLCLSTISLYKRFSFNKGISSGIVFSIFALSPLYLQNLSYQFDCLPMMLGVFLATIPYSNLVNTLPNKIKLPFTFICLISSLCLYQATINIFISIASFEVIYFIINNSNVRHIIKQALLRVLILLISIVFYMKIIAPLYVSKSVNSDLIFSSENPLNSFLLNLEKITSILNGMNNIQFYFAWFLPIILASIMFLVIIFNTIKSPCDTKGKIIKIGMLILSVINPILFIVGPFILIDNTIIAPRVMMGLPVVFLTITYICSYYNKPAIFGIVCFIPVLLSLSIASAYGNATKSQRSMEDKIFFDIASHMPSAWNNSKISINGTVGVTKAAQMEFNRYPILKYMVMPLNDWSGMVMLKHYNINALMGREAKPDKQNCIYENTFFSLCEGDINTINLR